MPDCLRWDYDQPDRKSFLVCGSRAWSWVEGEPRGQRYTIDADREMGLDLLLLPSSELATRYRARASRSPPGGEIELELEPLAAAADLVAATLRLDGAGRRPLALEWRDRDGNATQFHFSNWHRVDHPDLFAPPSRLEWSDPALPGGGLR